ncbi:TPA: stress response small protein YobI [Escherichia coli]|nr:stress response small protein YobI [Escherichia coli]
MNIRNSIKNLFFQESQCIFFITHFFAEYVIFKYLLPI